MNKIFTFTLLISLMCSLGYSSTKQVDANAGWIDLFDGETFKGWTQEGGKAKYEIRDGVIVGISKTGTPNSFMCTEKKYGDFELTFEVKCGKINSGVQIRSKVNKKGRVNGPQVEIEQGPGQAGFIYGEQLSIGKGWRSPEPMSKDNNVNQHNLFKNNEWNKYRVVAKGSKIQTYINDSLVAELVDEELYKAYEKGFLGLQVHSHKVADVEIMWRNIRLREL